MTDPICERCGQPIGAHSVYFDPPDNPEVFPEGKFEFETSGFICPKGDGE